MLSSTKAKMLHLFKCNFLFKINRASSPSMHRRMLNHRSHTSQGIVFPIYLGHINGILQYIFIFVWLLSLNIKLRRFILVVCCYGSFSPLPVKYFILQIYHIIQLLLDVWELIPVWAITGSATVIILMRAFCWTYVHISLGHMNGSRIAES